MSLLQRLPLSPLGWLALGAAVVSTALAVAAFRLPQVAVPECALEQAYLLPSGRTARLCELLPEPQPFTESVWLVVRLVVPEGQDADPEDARADHDWACEAIGLPAAAGQAPDRIIVQFMAEPFQRGEPAPGINQSIEAYSIRDNACMWELF